MLLSKRSRFVSNPIEEDDKLVEKVERQGKKVIKLNRGDPTKYFPTPNYIIKAYIEALKENVTTYATAQNTNALKEAISKRYSRLYNLNLNNEDITITAGVSEAIMFLNNALINESEFAINFKPYYFLYNQVLRLNGGSPILESYDENNNWNIDVDGLKKSLKKIESNHKSNKIKYMLITNPNNPTGTVLNRSILKEVVTLANEYKILLISDEIYDEIIYNKAKFTSVSELAKGVPHVILNGSSKVYDSTGFRIGFIMVPENDKDSKSLKEKLNDYAVMRLSANSPAQYAVTEAINNVREHNKAVKKMVKSIEERANYSVKLLNQNSFVETVAPNGAFYIFPRIKLEKMKFKTDKEFVDTLLEKEGIQVTRGSGFGAESHFRIVALPPKEILEYAINRINTFCKKYSK